MGRFVGGRNPAAVAALLLILFAPTHPGPAEPQGKPPSLPLDEIVRRFAAKEAEYASAHALYRYRLSVKIQEFGEGDAVVGEFEQLSEVSFDASDRRAARLLENPRTDLVHLTLSRVELEDLEFVPLFILGPEKIPDYEVAYLTRERLDEVDTYLFRLQPRRPARPGERLFDGVIWVDAERLDIVRAHGRSLPVAARGALRGYFRRVEVFREPVGDFLFPTYVRADDVISVVPETARARLILRLSNHERVRETPPAPAAKP